MQMQELESYVSMCRHINCVNICKYVFEANNDFCLHESYLEQSDHISEAACSKQIIFSNEK